MKRLITLASPLGGFFCGISSKCNGVGIPDFIMNMAAELIYSDFIQNLVGPTGYWRDPYNLKIYQKECLMLPDIDNIRNYDEQRQVNYLSIEKHVTFSSAICSTIQPWESA